MILCKKTSVLKIFVLPEFIMDRRIQFSIEGLTLRGFFEHMKHWVPFKGERLECNVTDHGPVSAFKERQIVGNIPKELSKQFRNWLKKDGELEAVVVTITPKMHRTKGDEVPVIYCFSGMDNPLMTNLKNSIERDIEKKKKRKKSLAFHECDITDDMEMDMPDNSLLSVLDQTNQLDFSVLGKSLRGFHVYKKKWVPEIGSRHECFINRQGAVAAIFGEEEVCGHVPTDIQKPWKRYLKESGHITAVVAGSPKRHMSKGEEVPMIYVFTADWTAILENLRRIVITDIERKMKKSKSLKIKPGDATSELRAKGHMTEARGSREDSDEETTNEAQENNTNEPTIQTLYVRSSRKRRLEEDSDTNETARIKKKKKKHSSRSDIERKMKKCKALQVQTGDATSEFRAIGNMTGERESRADSDDETANEAQENNTSEHSLQAVRSSRKRRLEEDNDTNETARIKKKKKKHSSRSGKLSTNKMDRKIELDEKDFYKISKMTGMNWKLLGLELGLGKIEISHVVMNNSSDDVIIKIFNMLVRLREVKPEIATLGHVIEAVNKCPKLEIDLEEFRNFINEKRSTLKSVN